MPLPTAENVDNKYDPAREAVPEPPEQVLPSHDDSLLQDYCNSDIPVRISTFQCLLAGGLTLGIPNRADVRCFLCPGCGSQCPGPSVVVFYAALRR